MLTGLEIAGYRPGTLAEVINHCVSSGLERSYHTTFEGLHAARNLYESFDYKLTEEHDVDQWAGGVKDQTSVRNVRLLSH